MSKKQEVTKLLKAESDRVKTVELHPKEPLVICSLYSGQVTLWNYETQTLLKSFEIVDLPVRCVKFITRLQSFVCGADDMNIRVYNYNTMEKTATFEAHMDYIRCLAVHDTLPLLLTSSDDMTVKMFDWSKNWACTMTFEGHGHYVMCVTFNPKDPATFATASLDELIMVWNIHTPQRNFSLEGHEGGVNCVEYYPGGDKPYLISGSDDSTVRVWDYQTKACIQVLSAHNHNVSCVAFHPDLPLVFTGSEDENLCTFSTQTWRLESTVGYNMGRAWYISVKPKCNKVALAFDKGLLVLKVGKEDPVMSMDPKGTIFFAQTNEIVKLDVKSGLDKDLTDGELIQLPSKEVGTSEGIPRKILHGPGGQYVAVVLDDDEYIVNSALGWRSKCFGHAIAFVWGAGNGTFAILENSYTLKTFKQFKLKDTVKLEGSADSLFAGPALGVRIDNNVYFYDWETLRIIRQVTENPNEVVWSDSGELCALVTDNAAFILKYHPDDVAAALASGAPIEEDGLDCAFDLVEEIPVKMRRALWVGDCLLYVNRSDRICYYIGGETTSLAVMQRGFSLLGYVAKENRLYCMDKERNITSYQLHTDVIDFKTHIVREDMTAAMEILPRIPESMRQKVAEFLQARGHIKLAMEVTTDLDHRFDLAIQLGELGVALGIVQEKPTQAKWKQVGDIALELAHFDIAVSALRAAHDYNGLLLFYTSTGDVEAVLQLGREAQAQGRTSIAFTCFLYAQDHEAVIDLLMAAQRYAEAAFHARTYAQHRICEVVDKWRVQMAGVPRIRDALADPVAYPNLFPTVDLNTYEEPAEEEEEDGVDRPTPGEPFSPQNSVVEPPQGYVPVAVPTSPPKTEFLNWLQSASVDQLNLLIDVFQLAKEDGTVAHVQTGGRNSRTTQDCQVEVWRRIERRDDETRHEIIEFIQRGYVGGPAPPTSSSPKQPSPDKPVAGSPPKAEAGDEIDDIFDDEGTGAEDSAHTAGATAQPLRDEDLERMFEDEE